jgi:hypothetical protein
MEMATIAVMHGFSIPLRIKGPAVFLNANPAPRAMASAVWSPSVFENIIFAEMTTMMVTA